MLLRKKLEAASTPVHRSTRAESDFLALDFASARNDRQIMRAIENEEILFSEICTKTNHQGTRQRRLVVLTVDALYIFKKSATYQKRLNLDSIQVLILSMESVSHCVLRMAAATKPSADSTSAVSNNSLMLDLSRRNALTKTLRQAVKKLKIVEVNHGVMERAFKDANFSLAKLAETQSALGNMTTTLNAFAVVAEEGDEQADRVSNLMPSSSAYAATNNATGRVASIRKRVSLVFGSTDKKLPPPQIPKRKAKATDVKALIRRASLLAFDAPVEPKAYFPRCPPCQVTLGVVQPIWSLVERALEPLLDSEIPPASGLVRCADILLKSVGENGPRDELDAIRAIALLCFDKDAARALLRSLHENIPILGGSALVDSLDALQRCESVPVRGWAVKSLWKLLPMCMSEHAMPITSTKWMQALNPEDGEEEDSGSNEGETWFVKTYFRGKIRLGIHEKEPLRRIAKRKASFSVLGGNYRSSTNFPSGLTPLLVQQAFSQVLLQNMFDVQRRAAFTVAHSREATRDEDALEHHQHHHLADAAAPNAVGVTEQDCIVALELLLNSLSNPNQERRYVDVTGKRIANTVLLPTLMGMLVLLEDDAARQRLLKDVSLLLLRSETNLKAVLDIPDWQFLFVPLLQTIPKEDARRSNEQRTLYKYVLNLLTMIHTYCFKEPNVRGGPLNLMLSQTCHSLAVFGGWNASSVGVARWIYIGLVTQLSMSARLWWHDAEAPEWTAFAHLVRSIEDFVFFHAYVTQEAVEAAAAAAAVATRVAAMEGDESDGELEEELEDARAPMGQRKKRQFSIIPVYELKEFAPILLPFSPRDAGRNASAFVWIAPNTTTVLAPPQQADQDAKRKSRRADASTAVAPATAVTTQQRREERFKHFGLHLGERANATAGGGASTTPLDLPLVECAVDLLKRMGITGNAPEDARRADLLKHATKKQKSLLKNASEWCQTLQTMQRLLVDLGSSAEGTPLENTMDRIAKFVEQRYEGKTVKLGVKQNKAVATKLEASVLKQRQLARQALLASVGGGGGGNGAPQKQSLEERIALPVAVSAPILITASPHTTPVKPPPPASAQQGKKSMIQQQQTKPRTTSAVSRVRFYSSVPSALEEGDDSALRRPSMLPPPPPPLLNGMIKKQSVMARSGHGISFDVEEGEDDGLDLYLLPPPPEPLGGEPSNAAAAVATAICDCCGDLVEEFDSVKHGEYNFHSDCFQCEECRCPLLKSENPDENNLFFQSKAGGLKKFCGLECRMSHLSRYGDDICPGCMCLFQIGDQAIKSCNRLWHMDHLQCQDCDKPLGVDGSEPHFPVEVETGVLWPFCTACHERRFKTCAKCNQGIFPGEDSFHALGRVFHQNHFNCFRCGDNFTGKCEFYVDGHGDAARALCFKCWNDSASPRICCDGCNQVLGDSDDCVELGGKVYHASRCFVCQACKTPLHEGEVFENPETSAPLCDTCFYAKRGIACAACHQVILENPLQLEDGTSYHAHCFACEECNDGLALTGRYILLPTGRPVCEQHWLARNGNTVCQCAACQLPIEQEAKLTLRDGAQHFHIKCFVCHYCQTPLVVSSGNNTQQQALNVGPDDMYYCDAHANGVCVHPGCQESCWADGVLRRIAGQFFCKQHYAKASEKYMEDACARCTNAIREYEGLEALGQSYHYECFVCTICQVRFEDEEDFTTIPGTQDAVHAHCL